MPRDEYDDRDRDDDDYDDRPRRRRRPDPDDRDYVPPKSNVGLILLIVGLVVGLPILGCMGLGIWGISRRRRWRIG